LQEDGIVFRSKKKFDIAVSSFAHHHISYDQDESFIQNLYYNLNTNGIYIVGDEFIPKFKDETERRRSLIRYHHHVIDLAEKADHFELANLEYECLLSGVRMIGDFKRSEEMIEEEIQTGGLFKMVDKTKIPFKEEIKEGGIFVYQFQKQETKG
jgi:SAM-dependent methyltransferase